jgi:hypothetical protein
MVYKKDAQDRPVPQQNAGTPQQPVFFRGAKPTPLPQQPVAHPLPANTVQGVIRAESGGNPNAKSSVGAQGLMQIMPKTGQELFQKHNNGRWAKYDAFDAKQNQELGTAYLQDLHNRFGGDIRKTLAAYNAGPGRVNQLIKTYGDKWINYAPAETQGYVNKIVPYLGQKADIGKFVPPQNPTPLIPPAMQQPSQNPRVPYGPQPASGQERGDQYSMYQPDEVRGQPDWEAIQKMPSRPMSEVDPSTIQSPVGGAPEPDVAPQTTPQGGVPSMGDRIGSSVMPTAGLATGLINVTNWDKLDSRQRASLGVDLAKQGVDLTKIWSPDGKLLDTAGSALGAAGLIINGAGVIQNWGKMDTAGKIGAGANLASGANAASQSLNGTSLLGAAAPAIAGIAGAAGLYGLTKDWGEPNKFGGRQAKNVAMRTGAGAASGLGVGMAAGAAYGATMGSAVPGIGNVIGAVIGAVVGAASGLVKAGKHKDQLTRDTIRKGLVEGGLIDKDYKIHLPDGSTYDMGRDGGKRDTYGGKRPYELDPEELKKNPQLGKVVSLADPLAELITSPTLKVNDTPSAEKYREQFAGYLTKAVTGSDDPRGEIDVARAHTNLRGIAEKMGINQKTLPDIFKSIDGMVEIKHIDAPRAAAYKASLSELFGQSPPTVPVGPGRGEQRKADRKAQQDAKAPKKPENRRKRPRKNPPARPVPTPPQPVSADPEGPPVQSSTDYKAALERIAQRNRIGVT